MKTIENREKRAKEVNTQTTRVDGGRRHEKITCRRETPHGVFPAGAEVEYPIFQRLTVQMVASYDYLSLLLSLFSSCQARIQDSTTGGQGPVFDDGGAKAPKSQNFPKIIRVPLM